MALNVDKEIAALKQTEVAGLRRKYAQVFGESITSQRGGEAEDLDRAMHLC
jgi:hypothetical protein